MASALPLIVLLCLAVGQLDVSAAAACRPPGWTRIGSRLFIVQRRGLTMADAEFNCIRLGGNLASIQSYGEHLAIRRLIRRVFRTDTRAWIGLFDAVQERKWMWTDGSKVRFTRWARNEPNNQGGTEHCTHINNGDYWNDRPCNIRYASVCSRGR
ncbi:galactose-specific lectin nattectin-like [Sparus aurata]|uniref:galactose-specific lectin nattectin-like n=1 Tax=Sparus aurata TaxID=8175 RepID=UPI0011C1CFAE|nr:galactose-specific lectin nattectin-like [Sparus aurata]